MLTRLESLERKQAELLSGISPDAWVRWKATGPTKALMLQFEIDAEELSSHWRNGEFVENTDKEKKAQGQAEYLESMPYLVRQMGVQHYDEG